VKCNRHFIETSLHLYDVLYLLSAGDEIIAINDTPVAGLTNAEVSYLIQRQVDSTGLSITARRHVMQRINRYM